MIPEKADNKPTQLSVKRYLIQNFLLFQRRRNSDWTRSMFRLSRRWSRKVTRSEWCAGWPVRFSSVASWSTEKSPQSSVHCFRTTSLITLVTDLRAASAELRSRKWRPSTMDRWLAIWECNLRNSWAPWICSLETPQAAQSWRSSPSPRTRELSKPTASSGPLAFPATDVQLRISPGC